MKILKIINRSGYLLKSISEILMKKIFKNCSGLSTNIKCLLNGTVPPENLKLYEITEHVNLENLAKVSDFLTERIYGSQINFSNKTINPFGHSSDKQDYIKIEGQGAKAIVSNILDLKNLNKVWNNKNLYLEVNRFSASRNSVCNANDAKAYSDAWHFDMVDMDTIMCFINLTDVTSENGPFCYLNSKKTKSYLSSLDLSHKLISNKVKEKDFSRLIGKKGKGLIIHNPSILHRASYVQSGFRDLIIIWFKIKKLK